MNFAPSGGARSAPIDPPERDLTPAAMIARATALRGLLRGAQAECEAQGRIPDAVNDELIRAGFYRVIQPRLFGGYEFDAPTFCRVMMRSRAAVLRPAGGGADRGIRSSWRTFR